MCITNMSVYRVYNGCTCYEIFTKDKAYAIDALVNFCGDAYAHHLPPPTLPSTMLDYDAEFLHDFSIDEIVLHDNMWDKPNTMFRVDDDGDISGDWAVEVCDAIRALDAAL